MSEFNSTKIKQLLKMLENNNFFTQPQLVNIFHDEPKYFLYTTDINLAPYLASNKSYYSYSTRLPDLPAGVSFFSKHLALMRCLSETVERISLSIYPTKSTLFASFSELRNDALSPNLYSSYTTKKDLSRMKLGWVKGYNVSTEKSCFIPAQLVYFHYPHYLLYQMNEGEILFNSRVSTGASAGTDRISTLLRGIYEVVERDAAMTGYLIKAHVPLIKINSIKNKKIQAIQSICQKYKLEWYLFDITNDLGIPVFMSILIDKTKVGPSLVAGTKANLDMVKAIIGSIEEVFIGRWSARMYMYRNAKEKKFINQIKPRSNLPADFGVGERMLYWSSPYSFDKISYLLNQNPKVLNLTRLVKNKLEEFLSLKSILSKKGYEVYYVDIAHDLFKKSGFFSYKVIIPGLQDIYLNEKHKRINIERLKEVSQYLKQEKLVVNEIPHFFL